MGKGHGEGEEEYERRDRSAAKEKPKWVGLWIAWTAPSRWTARSA